MFDRFRRKLAGVLSFNELGARSFLYMENQVHFVKDPDAIFIYQGIAGNQNLFNFWLEDHRAILHRVANCRSRMEQLLALRRETLDLIERVKRCLPLVLSKSYPRQVSLSDDDKRILIAKIHPDSSFQDAQMCYFQGWVYAEASCRCLRDISSAFGDARQNDWFPMYEYYYGDYIRFCYESMVADARGEIYPFGSAIDIFRCLTEEIKKKVLLGQNLEFDLNDLNTDPNNPAGISAPLEV
jgi:hypothetical protein